MSREKKPRKPHNVIYERWEGGRVHGRIVRRTEECTDPKCDANVEHIAFEGQNR